MLRCENCGGALKYKIGTDNVVCENCSSEFGVDSIQTADDTSISRCRQCGAELVCDSQELVPFCLYCGSQNMQSGTSKDSNFRPVHIIPFSKTKEDVRWVFSKILKRAKFLPDEYKDTNYIDSIVGVYVPYWDYRVDLGNNIDFEYTRSYPVGSRTVIETHKAHAYLDGYFSDIMFDASVDFPDVISDELKPFEYSGKRDFNSGYVAGFYADVPDTTPNDYSNEASLTADDMTVKCLERKYKGAKSVRLLKNVSGVDMTLMPVWFLHYCKGDRVSYMAMNGSNERSYIELPVDFKKAGIFACICALISFCILMMYATMNVDGMMFMIRYIGLALFLVSANQAIKIHRKEHQVKSSVELARKDIKHRNAENLAAFAIVVFSVSGFYAGAVIAIMVLFGVELKSLVKTGFGMVVPILIAVVVCLSSLVSGLKLVNDIWFYMSAILAFGVFTIGGVKLIIDYNRLASRKISSIERRGGDNRAY